MENKKFTYQQPKLHLLKSNSNSCICYIGSAATGNNAGTMTVPNTQIYCASGDAADISALNGCEGGSGNSADYWGTVTFGSGTDCLNGAIHVNNKTVYPTACQTGSNG